MMNNEEDLVYRLLKRAEIRRQISTRKSVQEGAPDRISDLLEEAAAEIKRLRIAVETTEKSAMTYREVSVEWMEEAKRLREERDS